MEMIIKYYIVNSFLITKFEFNFELIITLLMINVLINILYKFSK
jgi:hypothetical protein